MWPIWSTIFYLSGEIFSDLRKLAFSNTSFVLKVSIEAITECEVLVFNQDSLEKAFEATPHLQFIIDSLVSRDIAKKLYAVSDISHMGSGANKNPDHQGKKNLRTLDFRRTVSMDAIHTGGKGNVRSQDWIHEADLRQFQTGTMYLFTQSFLYDSYFIMRKQKY